MHMNSVRYSENIYGVGGNRIVCKMANEGTCFHRTYVLRGDIV